MAQRHPTRPSLKVSHVADRWSIASGSLSVPVSLEADDGGYVATDTLVGRYGSGGDEAAAVQDLLLAINDYYDELTSHSGRLSKQLEHDLALLTKLLGR